MDGLKTPRHVHPGVRTEADYRALQARYIAEHNRAFLDSPWPAPHVVEDHPPVWVSGGKVLVECPCGNCPSVSLEWGGLGLCFECGAVYEGLAAPAEFAAIERALMARPRLTDRYWTPGVAAGTLRDQNVAAGLPEEAEV